LACISGSIAHAYYRIVPAAIETGVRRRLPAEMLAVLEIFTNRYGG
jgi:hypothetical protein